jgi:hypothetical protein
MTTKKSWLEKIMKSVFAGILRIGDQITSISLSPRRRIFPKWFFWVKFIVFLVTLPWTLLLIVYVVVCIVSPIVSPFFSYVIFDNSRKESVRIHRVAVDGRKVLVDKRRRIGQGFELSRESPEYMHPGNMRPNATHRIIVRASSSSVPVAKDYICAIFIPPKWGDVYIYFEGRDDFRCQFWENKGY